MNSYLKKVEEFHQTFNGPVLKKDTNLEEPEFPSKERQGLRIHLLFEELYELEEAIKEQNIVEVLDAFCDLQYVLSGAIIEFGMKYIFDAAFNEVHRSNMTKLCDSEAEAWSTISSYSEPAHMIKLPNDKFLVMRTSDKKALKSINYSKAKLAQFI